MTSCNLIVIRSANMEALAKFYSALLDVELTKHRHGQGPEHYGCELGFFCFEIYPKRSDEDDTTAVRLGFLVDSIRDAFARLGRFEYNVVSSPKESPWGVRAVIDDPEGHRVELIEMSA